MEAVQYGLGPVGSKIALLGLKRGLRYVGAVDKDPAKVGRDMGDVIGLGEKLGVTVTGDPIRLLAKTGKVVVIHTTGSSLKAVLPQLTDLLKAGCTVVSTCEELSYPYLAHPEEAAALDGVARQHGGRLLGTGVNPGFVMDILPLCFSTAAQEVSSVKVERVVDAAKRREPLQKKVGVGLTPEKFKAGVEEGWIKHVGLPESVGMIAAGLGWRLDRVEETIDPVISPVRLTSSYVPVEPGVVAGIHQVARGYVNGSGEKITLDLTMVVDGRSVDRVAIDGYPPLTMEIKGGLHGDLVTASVVINAIHGLGTLEPGLHTMLDLVRARFGQPV
ncbi:MAG: dihydrodipicolinate reductase [Bacillota bacterium]